MKFVRLGINLFIIICLFIHGQASASDTPNVVLILADDLGYGDFSCYGASLLETPACDRLADEGMRFTDAHSVDAVCTPARYSILTGRYAWRSWLKNWVLFEQHPLLIETDRLTLGKLFQQAGYTTACVGKWHLGWGDEMNPDFTDGVRPGPVEVGFDTFFGVPFSHNSSRPLQVFMRDRNIINLKKGLRYDSEEAMRDTVRSLEDTAINLSKEAVAFIEQNKDNPFFLYYPTTNIHFPLTPNERFVGKSECGTYGDFVVEFDWAVGQVLDVLDRNGLTRNTIVIVTSDNGGKPQKNMYGHDCNGSLRGQKQQIYEGGHRVPLLVRWPGKIPKGTVSDETICQTDFLATFAGILGLTVPEGAAEDSYDMQDVLLGSDFEKPLREATVHHSSGGVFALRKGNWKLIEGSGNGSNPPGKRDKNVVPDRDPLTGKWTRLDFFNAQWDGKYQLYDLLSDPQEMENVAKQNPEIVEELSSILDRLRRGKQGL